MKFTYEDSKYDLTQILIGNQTYTSSLFHKASNNEEIKHGKPGVKDKETRALQEEAIFNYVRFVVEELLGWTPKEAEECLTMDVLADFKLDGIIKRQYVDKPEEVAIEDLPTYIVKRLYPNVLGKYDRRKYVAETYERSLKDKSLPQNFFARNSTAVDNFLCIISHMLNKESIYGGILERYEQAVDPKKFSKTMVSWGLNVSRRRAVFSSDSENKSAGEYGTPLWIVHNSLGFQKNDVAFELCRFIDYFNKESQNGNDNISGTE